MSFFSKFKGQVPGTAVPDIRDAPDVPARIISRTESQDEVYSRYAEVDRASRTRFNQKSGAYRFTNEPFGDLLNIDLRLERPVLAITGSGDPVCFFGGSGAQVIDAVDISLPANAWAEYKLAGFSSMNFSEFWSAFADSGST